MNLVRVEPMNGVCVLAPERFAHNDLLGSPVEVTGPTERVRFRRDFHVLKPSVRRTSSRYCDTTCCPRSRIARRRRFNERATPRT